MRAPSRDLPPAARDRRPLHVLLVTNEYPPEKTAGTAIATQFLAEELAARACGVTVVVNTRRDAPARETHGPLEVIRLSPLPVPWTRMIQRVALLARLARRLRPGVLQGQSLSCGALAWVVGRALGIPSVVYVQGLDLYQAGPLARRTYIRWALTGCDAAAAVTDDLRARASAVSGRRVDVIPHGLRLRPAHGLARDEARAMLGLPREAPLVLFAGRLIRLKGVEHLIRALPGVHRVHPEARLVLVGDGDDGPRLRRLVHALGLDDRVTFAGARAHEDVIRFMRAAEVFVLPSLVESFGIVLIEAMSCGLPIVASGVMGIPALIEDGVNGFLVRPADPHALADRIMRLLADPGRAAAMARANVGKASAYAVPRVAQAFLQMWEALAAPPVRGEASPAVGSGP